MILAAEILDLIDATTTSLLIVARITLGCCALVRPLPRNGRAQHH
ncbi:hypothetical protein ACH4E7_41215 [Kitasatospora sp. NPDC018058]